MKRKQRAALIRERNKQEREREEEQVKANFIRLKTSTGGFARSVPAKPLPKKTFIQQLEEKYVGRFSLREGSNRPDPSPVVKPQVRYEGEMLERELKAKQEAELLKARVAPLGNKMGNQYMTDTDLADFKAGKLRRRS